MKTKKIIFSILVLVFAAGVLFAQDDVYYNPDNQQTKEKREKLNKRKINTGYVFIDGKYVKPPYRVRRKGMVVYINGIPMTNKPVIKKQKDYLLVKKDPGLPPSVMKMDSIDAIYKDTVPHLGVTYIQAKFNYLLINYPYDEAINQAIDYYKSLPNIKSVTGVSGIELVAYNGDKTKILLGSSLSYNFSKSFGPNGDGLPVKRDYKSNYDNIVMQYIEKLSKAYVIFHFNDSIKYDGHFEVFFGNKQGVFIIKELHKIKLNNHFSDIEKCNYIRDSVFRGNAINKYIEILIANFNFSKIECLSISIDTNIEQNGKDKLDDFSCNTKGINEISSSPTSLVVNFGAAATWGTQYLALNPSFDAQKDAILSYIVDQGYYISPNYYVDYTNGDNNWNNLTYDNFIGFTDGGINYWDSHGQKTISTANGYIQGWIEVLYLNDNNYLDLAMAFDDWFLNNPKIGFGVFRVENPGDNNNWSGTNNRPYCLVAYSEVAQSHWQLPIIQNKSITIIGSCYGYQNGFIEACGEGGATFGYDGNSTGLFAKNNIRNLFQRLNGEISNNGTFYRNTYDAYNNAFGILSSFKMHPPNASITLCPATKDFYPSNNELVPSTVTEGYFEIDTWCDATIPA
ncbi:MAG: hypothetical protein RBR97_16330, partial [Bacteroidales bacterium]|nr:hypothetical protein [Bacteroidales bacterium]